MDILIDFVSQFIQNRNEDDHFDRLNYQITPFLFVLLSLVNISKLYIGSAINCFAKAEFKEGWVQYTNDYCLVESTYYIRSDETIPLQKELRNEKRIAYYQWVPFILILQACSFYIPHLIWRSFNWLSGFQIRAVVSASKDEQDTFKNNDLTKIIAKSLFHASQQQHQPICFVQKQTFVAFLYLTMKLAYVLLICFHLCLFKFFIGNIDFAIGILDHKGEWRQSGHFPRVTVCDFNVYKYAQLTNFTVECVLPLNMFNEKIFVFFFFWLCFLLCLTIFSICLWIGRIQTRKLYFHRLLNIYQSRKGSAAIYQFSEDNGKTPLISSNSSFKNNSVDLDFGGDLRVVLGLIQDQAGLLFCANLFYEICKVREMTRGFNDEGFKEIEEK